jgi:crotonobetainyl-CoA:carnitine CoA-transferase CaiB-like acyl-CoA transferase
VTAPGATGPLAGLKVIEMGSVGPVPRAGTPLADMGADVARVDGPSAMPPPGSQPAPPYGEVTLRGRRNIAVDLKHPDGRATLLDLVRTADVLLEGFRPGVMERLDVYECADHKFISVAAIEPQFCPELLQRLGLTDGPAVTVQDDPSCWAQLNERFIALFATHTRDQWCGLLEGTDACFAPVLTLSETAKHAHRAQRATLVELSGPSPAPVGAVPDGAGDPPRRYPP